MQAAQKQYNLGVLALRLTVAVVFIMMGWGKLQGIEGVEGMLSGLGFPAPLLFAYVLALVEFLGGIAILLGVYTRFFAKLLAFIMLVAFLTAHGGSVKEGMSALAFFGSTLALAFLGGGEWQLSKKDFSFHPFVGKK